MNTIICIGWLGYTKCYLNISKEEAIARYTANEGEAPKEEMIKVVQVTDEWDSYDGALVP